MAAERDSYDSEPMRQAVSEMLALLTKSFPGVVLSVSPGYDPDGLYIRAVLDTEDYDDYSDRLDKLVDMRLLELWGQGIDLFVMPGLPPHRTAERNALIQAGLL